MKIYYLLVQILSYGLMGIFVVLGSNEIVSPLVAIAGIFISLTSGIGACIDMRSRKKSMK